MTKSRTNVKKTMSHSSIRKIYRTTRDLICTSVIDANKAILQLRANNSLVMHIYVIYQISIMPRQISKNIKLVDQIRQLPTMRTQMAFIRFQSQIIYWSESFQLKLVYNISDQSAPTIRSICPLIRLFRSPITECHSNAKFMM